MDTIIHRLFIIKKYILKINEKVEELPFNKYALSKLQIDNYLKKQKNSNFSYLILRISTVYDKEMKSMV